jgi:hypothetical protein
MPLRDVLLALCAKWIDEGEYWRGDPSSSARLDCADDLLTVLGEDVKTFSMRPQRTQALLQPFQLPAHPAATEQDYMRRLRAVREQREQEERCELRAVREQQEQEERCETSKPDKPT